MTDIENFRTLIQRRKDHNLAIGNPLFTAMAEEDDEILNEIDSLRPHNRWKPRKILNEVLNFAANHENPHWNDYIFGTLNNLIRQLKKLREE